MVEIKDKYSWKTTSSKDLSTKLKYELAKKHPRNLITSKPELIEGHCINGELNLEARNLKEEYISIIGLAGYEYPEDDNRHLLDEDLTGLTATEIAILQQNEEYVHKNVPADNDIPALPKYCYYVPATDTKGDAFTCGRLHPNHKTTGKDWTTTKKSNVSTKEKFKQLVAYLEGKDYTPIEQQKRKKPYGKQTTGKMTPDDKFAEITRVQLLRVIELKNSNKTSEEASDCIKLEFDGLYIRRDFISKLWKGEVNLSDEIKLLPEYQDMLKNTKQRTVKATKFTAEEIEYVKVQDTTKYSLGEISKAFNKKFGKTITPAYISKLR
jgi:hypothetical protein